MGSMNRHKQGQLDVQPSQKQYGALTRAIPHSDASWSCPPATTYPKHSSLCSTHGPSHKPALPLPAQRRFRRSRAPRSSGTSSRVPPPPPQNAAPSCLQAGGEGTDAEVAAGLYTPALPPLQISSCAPHCATLQLQLHYCCITFRQSNPIPALHAPSGAAAGTAASASAASAVSASAAVATSASLGWK